MMCYTIVNYMEYDKTPRTFLSKVKLVASSMGRHYHLGTVKCLTNSSLIIQTLYPLTYTIFT